MYDGSDSYGRAGLLAASVALAVLLYLGTCATARATPFDVRYRNPGAELAYDALDVCADAACRRYPVACAPGATCALVADLPTGPAEVSLVGRLGELESDPSNRRTVEVAPLEGCAWDFDGEGWVSSVDFGEFLRRFTRGELNSLDFAAFLRAFGQPCQ